MDELKELRIVDNFYQTSAFFPMPTVLAGTVSENGKNQPRRIFALLPLLRGGQRLLRHDFGMQKQFQHRAKHIAQENRFA